MHTRKISSHKHDIIIRHRVFMSASFTGHPSTAVAAAAPAVRGYRFYCRASRFEKSREITCQH